jgi:hypothetical protein
MQEAVENCLDPLSFAQCLNCCSLLNEIQSGCPVHIQRNFSNHVAAPIERVFAQVADKICLPLLKLSVRVGEATEDNGALSASDAKEYLLSQLDKVQRFLRCLLLFRLHKYVKQEFAARVGWRMLAAQMRQAVLKLLKTTANLKVCLLVFCLYFIFYLYFTCILLVFCLNFNFSIICSDLLFIIFIVGISG